MPSAFICSSSRCNSGFVTAGPNHHHRIMIRQSAGGFTNDFSKDAIPSSWAAPASGCKKHATRTKTTILPLKIDIVDWVAEPASKPPPQCTEDGVRNGPRKNKGFRKEAP